MASGPGRAQPPGGLKGGHPNPCRSPSAPRAFLGTPPRVRGVQGVPAVRVVPDCSDHHPTTPAAPRPPLVVPKVPTLPQCPPQSQDSPGSFHGPRTSQTPTIQDLPPWRPPHCPQGPQKFADPPRSLTVPQPPDHPSGPSTVWAPPRCRSPLSPWSRSPLNVPPVLPVSPNPPQCPSRCPRAPCVPPRVPPPGVPEPPSVSPQPRPLRTRDESRILLAPATASSQWAPRNALRGRDKPCPRGRGQRGWAVESLLTGKGAWLDGRGLYQ